MVPVGQPLPPFIETAEPVFGVPQSPLPGNVPIGLGLNHGGPQMATSNGSAMFGNQGSRDLQLAGLVAPGPQQMSAMSTGSPMSVFGSEGWSRPQEKLPLLPANGYGQNPAVMEAEEIMKKTFSMEEDALDERSIMDFHDAQYRRFLGKYGTRPEVQVLFREDLGQQEQDLLGAIRAGDVEKIRSFRGREGFKWDFVYPPAKVHTGFDGQKFRTGEGWCRSPLGLLILPTDNILDPMLPNVDDERRLHLIKEILRDGAGPSYPPVYWANPAVLACLAGDLPALKLLEDWGCDLAQKVEFALHPRPEFTLVHAAAVNGHLHILRYLREKLPPDVFTAKAAENSNPLHMLLQHSKDIECAKYLLDHGCDGFAFNDEQKSPLSLAIEFCQEFAQELLERKSSRVSKWLGKDVFLVSVEGVILPLEREGGPVRARASSGKLMTIEEMIIAFEAKELLLTPLMQDLIKLKWQFFGKYEYMKKLVPYMVFVISVLVATTASSHSIMFQVALAVTVPLVLYELHGLAVSNSSVNLWKVLDIMNLVNVTICLTYKVLHMLDVTLPDKDVFRQIYAVSSTALQLLMATRALRIIVVDKLVGPLLIAVAHMVVDTFPWLILLAISVIGYANAFYALAHSDPARDLAEEMDFDFSYASMVKVLLMTATAMDSSSFLELPDKMPEDLPLLQYSAWFLFWTFTGIAVLILFNLLIALYNTAYVKIVEGSSAASWAFLRLQLLAYMEANKGLSGVKEYYEQLLRFDNRRTFLSLDSS